MSDEELIPCPGGTPAPTKISTQWSLYSILDISFAVIISIGGIAFLICIILFAVSDTTQRVERDTARRLNQQVGLLNKHVNAEVSSTTTVFIPALEKHYSMSEVAYMLGDMVEANLLTANEALNLVKVVPDITIRNGRFLSQKEEEQRQAAITTLRGTNKKP